MKRFVPLLGVAIPVLAGALPVAGCGDSHSVGGRRSILYSGVSLVGATGARTPNVVTDAEAFRADRTTRAFWRSNLASGTLGPASDLSPRQFRARVARAASRYGFTVERVGFVRTRGQFAPLVIAETRNYRAFTRATPAIVRSLNPLTDRPNRSTGENFWTFPGLYLEARDERGVPFLIVDDFPTGGGQWARSDELYPFVRG